MDIIALFSDIDYFLFLTDKEIGQFGRLEFIRLRGPKR